MLIEKDPISEDEGLSNAAVESDIAYRCSDSGDHAPRASQAKSAIRAQRVLGADRADHARRARHARRTLGAQRARQTLSADRARHARRALHQHGAERTRAVRSSSSECKLKFMINFCEQLLKTF